MQDTLTIFGRQYSNISQIEKDEISKLTEEWKKEIETITPSQLKNTLDNGHNNEYDILEKKYRNKIEIYLGTR